MTSKRLTPEQVHAVGVAAFENAFATMADATLLLDQARLPRAFALGVIAVEEAAKFQTCRYALMNWDPEVTVASLGRALRPKNDAHVTRYAEMLAYLAVLGGFAGIPIPDIDRMARGDMTARERALYVEVASSGVPMTPEDLSEEDLRTWLTAMADHFATMAGAWRSSLDDYRDQALGTAMSIGDQAQTEPDVHWWRGFPPKDSQRF